MDLTKFNTLLKDATRAADAAGLRGQPRRSRLVAEFADRAGIDPARLRKPRYAAPKWQTRSELRDLLEGLTAEAGLTAAPKVRPYKVGREMPAPARLDGPRGWAEIVDTAGVCVGVTNGAVLGFGLPWSATKCKVPPAGRPKAIKLESAEHAARLYLGRVYPLDIIGVTEPTVNSPIPMLLLAAPGSDDLVLVQDPFARWFFACFKRDEIAFCATVSPDSPGLPSGVLQVRGIGKTLGAVMPFRPNAANKLPTTRSEIQWAS